MTANEQLVIKEIIGDVHEAGCSMNIADVQDVMSWCLALYGNHDEHQCYLPPGHDGEDKKYPMRHMCYCGVWW